MSTLDIQLVKRRNEIADAIARDAVSEFDGLFDSLNGKPTTLAGYGITDAQPLDADLTAIAGLVTNSFGRELLTKADAAAIRSYIGAGSSSFDGAFASLTGIPTTIAGYGITDFNSLGDARWSVLAHTHTFASLTSKPTTLAGYGIVDAQILDADLTTLAGLTATTDNFIVSVASVWASRTPAQVRTTLGLVIGMNVQAFDADLTTWAAITPAAGIGTFLAAPTSANLLAAVTNETGSGALVFGTSPTFTGTVNTPALNVTAGNTTTTGFNVVKAITGFPGAPSGIGKIVGMYYETTLDSGVIYCYDTTALAYKKIAIEGNPLHFQPGGVFVGATLVDPGANNLQTQGKIIAGAQIRLKGYTVATLPSGTQGDTAFVTDALAPTFLSTVVGGGAVVTPVFYNGTSWVGY